MVAVLEVLAPVMGIALILLGVLAVIRSGNTTKTKDQLADRLLDAEEVLYRIEALSMEQAHVGDPFAQVVLDEVRQYDNSKHKDYRKGIK